MADDDDDSNSWVFWLIFAIFIVFLILVLGIMWFRKPGRTVIEVVERNPYEYSQTYSNIAVENNMRLAEAIRNVDMEYQMEQDKLRLELKQEQERLRLEKMERLKLLREQDRFKLEREQEELKEINDVNENIPSFYGQPSTTQYREFVSIPKNRYRTKSKRTGGGYVYKREEVKK
jgi:hypothetical protein